MLSTTPNISAVLLRDPNPSPSTESPDVKKGENLYSFLWKTTFNINGNGAAAPVMLSEIDSPG